MVETPGPLPRAANSFCLPAVTVRLNTCILCSRIEENAVFNCATLLRFRNRR